MAVSTMSPTEAVSLYSSARGEAFEFVGALAGGETGATEVRSSDGTRLVLKWEADPSNIEGRLDGVSVAERLRVEAGWPVPVQRVDRSGPWLFVAQQFMPGETVTHLGTALIEGLLAIHESRLGLAEPDPEHRWGNNHIEILVSGGHGYCLHEPLREHDHRTRRVVERIEEIGRSLTPDQLSGNDLVHADLHPGNMLQADGRLSAIVDLDYSQVGDAAFDLVFLAVMALAYPRDPGVRQRLHEVSFDQLDQPRRLAYSGNLMLRLLDWPIRKGRPEEIEFWLTKADQLLAD